MRKTASMLLILSSFLFLFPACYNDNEYDLYPFTAVKCDSINSTYSNSIAQIMTDYCNVCHSASNPSGNVITDNYDGLNIVAKNGKLWGGVNWESGYVKMPNNGNQLSSCDLGKIKHWINAGSPNN
jgi:hypothetical protein